MTAEHLISRIEAFAQRRGWQPATVTSRAVGNSRLYRRLKEGGTCTLSVADRLIEFMDTSPVDPEEVSRPETIIIDDSNNVKGDVA